MKLTTEQRTEIKEAMEQTNYKHKTINGVDHYINAAVKEGIEMKGDKINPYAIDSEDKVFGYDVVGDTTRRAVDVIEQVLCDLGIEDKSSPIMDQVQDVEIIPPELGGGKIVEQLAKNKVMLKEPMYAESPEYGILPKYLTDEIIAKHPGTISALISLQKTNELYIQERPGPRGTVLRYVDTGYFTTALNWATLMKWDFQVLETREDIVDDKQHFTVLGKLTITTTDGDIISKEQFGSQIMKKGSEVGDNLKAAASDAMKKCGSALGIAADIYGSG